MLEKDIRAAFDMDAFLLRRGPPLATLRLAISSGWKAWEAECRLLPTSPFRVPWSLFTYRGVRPWRKYCLPRVQVVRGPKVLGPPFLLAFSPRVCLMSLSDLDPKVFSGAGLRILMGDVRVPEDPDHLPPPVADGLRRSSLQPA